MRSRCYQVITDNQGNLLPNSAVRLLQPETDPATGVLVAGTVYAAKTGTDTLGSEFTTTSGVVEFWMDDPQFVQIAVTPPNSVEFTIDNVPVFLPVAPTVGGEGLARPEYGHYNLALFKSAVTFRSVGVNAGVDQFNYGPLQDTWTDYANNSGRPAPIDLPMPEWMRVNTPSTDNNIQVARGWWAYHVTVMATFNADPGWVGYTVDADWSGAGGTGLRTLPFQQSETQWNVRFDVTSLPIYSDGSHQFNAEFTWKNFITPSSLSLFHNFVRLSPLDAVPVYLD